MSEKIDEQQVRNVAKLARLEMTDEIRNVSAQGNLLLGGRIVFLDITQFRSSGTVRYQRWCAASKKTFSPFLITLCSRS